MGAGGACGAVLRHVVSHAVSHAVPDEPVSVAVVVVNVVGAVALGVLVARPQTEAAGLFWRTGVLGAFTTYGAMAVEAVHLGSATGPLYAIVLTVVGVGAARLGLRLGAPRPDPS